MGELPPLIGWRLGLGSTVKTALSRITSLISRKVRTVRISEIKCMKMFENKTNMHG